MPYIIPRDCSSGTAEEANNPKDPAVCCTDHHSPALTHGQSKEPNLVFPLTRALNLSSRHVTCTRQAWVGEEGKKWGQGAAVGQGVASLVKIWVMAGVEAHGPGRVTPPRKGEMLAASAARTSGCRPSIHSFHPSQTRNTNNMNMWRALCARWERS